MAHVTAPSHLADGALLGAFHLEFFTPMENRSAEYRLRHAVFVEERHWLSGRSDAVGLERDQYDDYSLSFLLRDAASGEPAACQRLILADRLPAGMLTPIEMLLDGRATLGAVDRRAWAEVSRTTIAARYRWGSRACATPAMRAIKHASIAVATATGLDTLFSVSDPRTARLVRRLGFPCHRFGGLVQHHGPRALYRMEMREIRESVPQESRRALCGLTDHARAVIARWPTTAGASRGLACLHATGVSM
jgi:N-acyl amino acid synthase of PEP-CTERM/exosortase system